MTPTTTDISLDTLLSLLADKGCRRFYTKQLAANDNAKNQVYLGGNFRALSVVPYGAVIADGRSAKPRFKAPVDMRWVDELGAESVAPGAQLILYPQYPEVRFSGFLRGSAHAPSDVMTCRDAGRVLIFGVVPDGRVYAWAGFAETAVARELVERKRRGSLRRVGVFLEIAVRSDLQGPGAEVSLLTELGRIHRLGWIRAKRLRKDGSLVPCRGPNCGGFTLEAELGVPANSRAAPDYLGYEVKQHRVTDFRRPASGGAITLMTPEPTGGLYREKGVETFIRAYGYPDRRGREDRLNVGGLYRIGVRVEATGLTLVLLGWEATTGRIVDDRGGVALIDDAGTIAAMWHFTSVMDHWRAKYDRAVYVPSMCSDSPLRYRYGDLVRLGEGADFLLLLKAMASGSAYYDPGIKLEHVSTAPRPKQRSQFRMKSADVRLLFETMRTVGVL